MKIIGVTLLAILCINSVLSTQTSEDRLHALLQEYLLVSEAQHAQAPVELCFRQLDNKLGFLRNDNTGVLRCWPFKGGERCKRVNGTLGRITLNGGLPECKLAN